MSTSLSNSMASIEEIVKFQQELLNHQRNQKQIQNETIKLLNALNKNITFMSERLDQFAMRTNMKLNELGAAAAAATTTAMKTTSPTAAANNRANHQNKSPKSVSSAKLNNRNILNSNNSGNKQLKNNKHLLHHNHNHHTTVTSEESFDDLSFGAATSDFDDEDDIDNDDGGDFDDDEEKETIQIRKKSRLSSASATATGGAVSLDMLDTSESKSASGGKLTPKMAIDSEESNNQQRLFNKYVRESVEKRLGKDFLLLHEIQEISQDIMEEIKIDALRAYPPINIRPRRAWHLAKASLRCRRRSLRRQKEKQIYKIEDE